MLDDEPIRRRIDELRYAADPDRALLERIARAIRASLIERRKPGRKSRTPRELVTVIPVIQAAFDGCRTRLKKRYRNQGARQLDIRAISGHVAAAVPPQHRREVADAAARVLVRKPGVTKSFGSTS
jgi:hypothetical protein